MVEEIADYLAGLSSADAVRAECERYGVCGFVSHARFNPVTELLMHRFPLHDAYADEALVKVWLSGQKAETGFATPQAVAEFLRRYHAGEFTDLVLF